MLDVSSLLLAEFPLERRYRRKLKYNGAKRVKCSESLSFHGTHNVDTDTYKYMCMQTRYFRKHAVDLIAYKSRGRILYVKKKTSCLHNCTAVAASRKRGKRAESIGHEKTTWFVNLFSAVLIRMNGTTSFSVNYHNSHGSFEFTLMSQSQSEHLNHVLLEFLIFPSLFSPSFLPLFEAWVHFTLFESETAKKSESRMQLRKERTAGEFPSCREFASCEITGRSLVGFRAYISNEHISYALIARDY